MNMDRGLVNRALLDAGQSPLTDQDIQDKNSTWVLAKEFYIATWVESLSEINWTGGRKRTKLALTGMPHLKPDTRFLYDLPLDCARPVELQNNAAYRIEGRFLYTEQEKAELLYITNGKQLRPVASISAGGPGDFMEAEYISAGRPSDTSDFIIRAGRPVDIIDEFPPDPEPAEDFPDYRLPDNGPFEPAFWLYLEKTLAAKFAMKLSEQPQLHLQLLQEAILIAQNAANTSLGSSASRKNAQKWWAEELGLS
jgi:hypothetical protein